MNDVELTAEQRELVERILARVGAMALHPSRRAHWATLDGAPVLHVEGVAFTLDGADLVVVGGVSGEWRAIAIGEDRQPRVIAGGPDDPGTVSPAQAAMN